MFFIIQKKIINWFKTLIELDLYKNEDEILKALKDLTKEDISEFKKDNNENNN